MDEDKIMERFSLELSRKEAENEELRRRIELMIELGKHCATCTDEGAAVISEAQSVVDRQRGRTSLWGAIAAFFRGL